ncbi:AMP-binding protein [Nocardia sp. NPDC058058]|uniref:AMP-binding protein n=1 Tax=Nocardia sp. NPDC058058 TaxID=3346317 RepID=UPI0036DC0064
MALLQENALATAVREALSQGADLRILNKDENRWDIKPWGEVLEHAEGIAAHLQSLQVNSAPTPVAVIGEPSYETVATVLAAWLAGRASTILPGPNRFASLESWAARTTTQLTTLGVDEVFCQGAALRALTSVAPGSVGLRVADLDEVNRWRTAPAGFTPTTISPGTVSIYQGTAGSTGIPKSVALTAPAALANVRDVLSRQRFRTADDVLCSWLPLYHDMGLMMLLAGVVTGAPTWLAPTSAFAKSPFDWLEWLTASGATITAAPNFAYALLGRYARLAGGADLSALRVAINGGEPIDVSATQRFSEQLAPAGFDARAVCASYGLAEATCGLTMPAAAAGLSFDEVAGPNGAPHRAALLGAALDGVELRVVPTTHRTDFDAERPVGEVQFRSTAQMIGYFGDTAIAPGQWIGTGDLGYLVDDQLIVCGRSKELITIAGRNIFPQEIERAVAGVAGVRPGGIAAVSGGGTATRRDQLVVVAEYLGDDEPAARRLISERVAAECGVTPGLVDLVAAGTLPKTTSGKLRRVEIAAGYR